MIKTFTSESVSEGHPDKIADQISDGILDAYLQKDPNAHVACETFVKTGMVLVGGEINSTASIDIEPIVRNIIKDIGYTDSYMGFDANSCAVISAIGRQSPDINQGVSQEDPSKQGAGDQGLMFGFAVNETEELMPAPIMYAHKLMQKQAEVRKTKIEWLLPDAKSQVTVVYDDNKIQGIDTIVLSTQHKEDIPQSVIKDAVIEEIIKPVIPSKWLKETKYFINPTGKFVIGGPMGDCGLTGRKIIVDTYGGYARHGGGAFSGKDPSKVDRSAAYAARWLAKSVVKAKIASKCEIQISYAIGIAEPVSIMIDTFGTGTIPDNEIAKMIMENFDLTPYGIIKNLDLKRPIYKQTSVYGHFGRDIFPWEDTSYSQNIMKM